MHARSIFVCSPETISRITSCIEISPVRDAEMVSRAETTAFEEEHNDSVTTIEFRIRHHVEFGEEVHIVGSVRELGKWDADDGSLPLHWSENDLWSAIITVKRADVPRLEYKYIVRSQDGKTTWEKGGNHNILKKPSRSMIQEDFWEFPGFNCRV
jgi:hypothetical protein